MCDEGGTRRANVLRQNSDKVVLAHWRGACGARALPENMRAGVFIYNDAGVTVRVVYRIA